MRLAADGFHVLAVGRDERALSDVCRDIERAKGSAERLAIDVTSDDAPRVIVAKATTKADGIDAIVNAAGIIAAADISATTDAAWDEMMTINVRAPFRLLREAVPALAARRGAVVNLSSVAGTRAFPNLMAYCVSKSAVDQFTRTAALDLAPRGIRERGQSRRRRDESASTRRHGRGEVRRVSRAFQGDAPLGRAGTPEEVASLIGYLVSPDAAWITGDTISIDGGRHLTCLR